MPAAARHRIDFEHLYAQLQQLPEGMRGEIVEGQLYAMTRPFSPHATAQLRMGQDLAPYDRRKGTPNGPGGWIFQIEPEIHFISELFGMDVLVPDVAAWRRERLTVLPRSGYIELAPDWICEVLSEATAAKDRGAKRRIYSRSGVRWLWLVDPLKRTLEAQRCEINGAWTKLGRWQGEARVRAEPFADVELDLSRWWEDIA